MIDLSKLDVELQRHRRQRSMLGPGMFCTIFVVVGILGLAFGDLEPTGYIVSVIMFVFAFLLFIWILSACIVHRAAYEALLSLRRVLPTDEDDDASRTENLGSERH